MQISDHEVLKDQISVFARAYHYRNNHTWVFADPVAEKMLTDEEYTEISQNMSRGIRQCAMRKQMKTCGSCPEM